MRLADICLVLFIIMKMIYNYWADYFTEDYHWAAIYYAVTYLLLASWAGFIYRYAITESRKYLYVIGFAYFVIIGIIYLVCLIEIDLFEVLLTQRRKVTVGQIGLISILMAVNFLRIKRHLIINRLNKTHERKK